MSAAEGREAVPGLVAGLCERWGVRADGALAHHLQEREVAARLTHNRSRNRQIREDFPVALGEQEDLLNEARAKEAARMRQAERDAEIARRMADTDRHPARPPDSRGISPWPGVSRPAPPDPGPESMPFRSHELDHEELGLSSLELDEMRRRLIQEERDLRLAKELSHENEDRDALLVDMRFAVEAQDGELAKLLQEREYKKLQRAKEKARLKKQQRREREAAQAEAAGAPSAQGPILCDAYSNPRDVIRQNGLRLCKSVDSDLHYVEPFEKEHVQSKASALRDKEFFVPNREAYYSHNRSESDKRQGEEFVCRAGAGQHRAVPPPPAGRKPRFPDPLSIRPASHYPSPSPSPAPLSPAVLQNLRTSPRCTRDDNIYDSTFPAATSVTGPGRTPSAVDSGKRLSVMSEITVEGLEKRKSKKEMNKKKKACKIQ